MAKRSAKGVVISIIVALCLVALPITVKVVLDTTLNRSNAEVDSGAAYSHRVPVEAEEDQPFYEKYLPELAAGVVFIWMVSILLFLGFKKRKDEVA